METATAFWALDDLLTVIVRRVVDEGRSPHEVIDDMGPIRLRPGDHDQALREGIRSLVNEAMRDYRAGRSGKRQSARGRLSPVAEASQGLVEFADQVLSRLVFETADERMASVLEFTHEDARAAYHRRVQVPREQAEREESFWSELLELTSGGWTLARRSAEHRGRMARLAVEARLTERSQARA